MRHDKEQVYDEKISPLMTQIISICKEHHIQMLGSFFLREPTGDEVEEHEKDLCCTTYLQFENAAKSERIQRAYNEIYKRPSVMSFIVSSVKQGGEIDRT